MDVTLLGMMTEERLQQSLKALPPMNVTLLGMSMDVRPLQPENAYRPIDVTLSGIDMVVISACPKKAQTPMDVTLLGKVVFLHPTINVFDEVSMIALQLLRESYFGLSFSTSIEVRAQQPEKAPGSMYVKLLGMVIEVRLLH